MRKSEEKKCPTLRGEFLAVLERCTKKVDVLSLLEDEGYSGEQAELAKRHWMKSMELKRRAKSLAVEKSIKAKKLRGTVNTNDFKRLGR